MSDKDKGCFIVFSGCHNYSVYFNDSKAHCSLCHKHCSTFTRTIAHETFYKWVKENQSDE